MMAVPATREQLVTAPAADDAAARNTEVTNMPSIIGMSCNPDAVGSRLSRLGDRSADR